MRQFWPLASMNEIWHLNWLRRDMRGQKTWVKTAKDKTAKVKTSKDKTNKDKTAKNNQQECMRLKIGFSRPRLNRQQFALSEEKQEDEWGCTFSIEQFAKLALSDKNDISQLWRGWGGNSGFPRAHRCPALPRCLHTHPLWHCCPCQVIRLEVFLIRRWGGTPDICHFFYTDRIFKSQILHPKSD